MKQTIKQMQARIVFLKDAAGTAEDFLTYLGTGTFDSRMDFFRKYVMPLVDLRDASQKSRVKHAEVAEMLEQAEKLAPIAIRAALEATEGRTHYMPIEKWVENVRAHKSAVYAYVEAIVAEVHAEEETAARVLHIEETLTKAGIPVGDDGITIEVFSAIQLVGSIGTAARAAKVLKAAGYDVETSEFYIATYYIEKTGPIPTPPQEKTKTLACSASPVRIPPEEGRPVRLKDAGLMTAADLPLYIKEIIFTKVQAVPAPYYFSLRGTPGHRTTTHDSALGAFDKLCKYCESLGAEVRVIRNGFKASEYFSGNTKAQDARLIVEITDPAARLIEQALELIHGKHWKVSKPKDGYAWKFMKEEGSLPL